MFLWLRQRACYKNPSLAMMQNKFARIVSAAIMPVFITMSLIGKYISDVEVVAFTNNLMKQ